MKYIHLIIALFICSCQIKKEHQAELALISGKEYKYEERLSLNTITDSIESILLEANDSCLITSISNVQTDGDLFFVQDKENNLFVFNRKGKFLRQISKRGEAPFEFLNLRTFFLDKNKKTITLICSTKKNALVFDYEGHFIKSSGFNNKFKLCNKIVLTSDNDTLVNYFLPSTGAPVSHEYKIFNKQEKNFSPYLLNSGNAYYRFSHLPMSLYKDHVLLTCMFSDTIYSFQNGKVIPLYQVHGNKEFTNAGKIKNEYRDQNYIDVSEKLMKSGFDVRISNILETDQYIIVCIGNNNNILWDKEKKQGVTLPWMSYDAINLILNFSGIRWLKENTVMDIISARNEDDNPTIYLYHLKKDILSALENKQKQYSITR